MNLRALKIELIKNARHLIETASTQKSVKPEHIFHKKRTKLLQQETQYETLVLTTSRNKVVNEERRRVAVLGSKDFAVRCGVREGNLVFGQMTAKHKCAPEDTEKQNEWTEYYLFQIFEVKCTYHWQENATWRCPACGWRFSSAWPDWTPRFGWSHREPAQGWLRSTKLCVSPWNRPLSCLSDDLVAPGLCKPEEMKRKTRNIKIWKMFMHVHSIPSRQ